MNSKRGLTKIVIKRCEDCKEKVQVLAEQKSEIVSVRCPDCFKKWEKKNKAERAQRGESNGCNKK